MHVMEHDMEGGDVKLIKKSFYQVSTENRALMDAELTYMLTNSTAETSSSAVSL